jgi:hypothetical protein
MEVANLYRDQCCFSAVEPFYLPTLAGRASQGNITSNMPAVRSSLAAPRTGIWATCESSLRARVLHFAGRWVRSSALRATRRFLAIPTLSLPASLGTKDRGRPSFNRHTAVDVTVRPGRPFQIELVNFD